MGKLLLLRWSSEEKKKMNEKEKLTYNDQLSVRRFPEKSIEELTTKYHTSTHGGHLVKTFYSEEDESYTIDGVDENDLEIILRLVKKAQEKLVNKQIQEIQDSKNQSRTITQTGSDNKWIIDASINIDKIEDNQKIVQGMIDYCTLVSPFPGKKYGKEEWKSNVQNHKDGYANFPFDEQTKNAYINLIKWTTGKDIHNL